MRVYSLLLIVILSACGSQNDDKSAVKGVNDSSAVLKEDTEVCQPEDESLEEKDTISLTEDGEIACPKKGARAHAQQNRGNGNAPEFPEPPGNRDRPSTEEQRIERERAEFDTCKARYVAGNTVDGEYRGTDAGITARCGTRP